MPSDYPISERFADFIQGQVRQGRYASAEEVVEEALRMLEVRDRFRSLQLEALRAEVLKGVRSGPGRPLDEVAQALVDRYRQWEETGAPNSAV